VSQPREPRERIEAGNDALLCVRGHPVTINEVHASILGLTSGVLVGLTWGAVNPGVAVALSALLALHAILGRPLGRSCPHTHEEYELSRSIGRQIIRHEPWWYLGFMVPALVMVVVVVP